MCTQIQDLSGYFAGYISQYQDVPICRFYRAGKIVYLLIEGFTAIKIPGTSGFVFSAPMPLPDYYTMDGLFLFYNGKVCQTHVANNQVIIANFAANGEIPVGTYAFTTIIGYLK